MSVRTRVEKIEQECDGVWSQYGVTSWERNFLESIKERSALSEKQEDILTKIEVKVFEEN
jgi:hypothetical protein